MKISEDYKLDFDDVLIKPKRSTIESRKDVDIIREFKGKYAYKPLKCCPVIAANMDTTGTLEMAKSISKFDCLTALHKFYDKKILLNHLADGYYPYTMITIGISNEDIDKLKYIKDSLVPAIKLLINIDVANGYTERFVDFVKAVRKQLPNDWISAGNVCTPEMTEQLILSGADIVKVGIGPGSVCDTRIKTGIGYGQLSAILECKDAAHGLGGLIIADGGCKNAGDVCKAFGAGADFVMIGGMLSGTDECEGEWEYSYELDPNYEPKYIYDDRNERYDYWEHKITGHEKSIRPIIKKKTALKFYGMSSHEAQQKHYGQIQDYRAAEGKCITVPYKGKAEDVIKDIQGGLRSCCAYVGARRLKDLDKCCSFVRVNRIK